MLKHLIFTVVVCLVIYMVGTVELIIPIPYLPAVLPKPDDAVKQDKD